MIIPPKEHIKILKEIAISRGGKLISKEYLGGRVKLKFKDAAGNIFYTCSAQIKKGTWSPYEGLISEPLCRQAMNHLFHNDFQKTSDVLTAKILNRRFPLELDGYCSKLNIAFEYQGYPSHWRPTYRNYEKTTARDLIKKNICKQLNIDLIVIPPFPDKKDKWKAGNVITHILEAVQKFYIHKPIPHQPLNIDNFKVDLSKNNHCVKMLNKLNEVAKANHGKLLSKSWKGAKHEYKFEDFNGIKFKIVAGNLLNPKRGWPKNPALLNRTSKQYIEELKTIAETNGGKLLSKKWRGNDKEYRFLFKDGREFKSTALGIRNRSWPIGVSKLFNSDKDYLKELRKLAKDNGFKLLETKWFGSDAKYRFLTPCKREISMAANKVKTEGFIKDLDFYFKTPEQCLDDLRKIADANEGTLLEEQWLGNEIPHRFKFKDGRETTFKPHRLKNQGWPQDLDNYFSQKSVVGMTDKDKIERMKNIADANGGKLLDSEWMGYIYKYNFLFTDGRPFVMSSNSLLNDGWPKGESTLFFDDNDYLNELKIIAEANNGRLLDTKWLGNRSSYRFQFEDGREFSIVPASLKNRGWPKDPDLYFNQTKGKAKSEEEHPAFITNFAEIHNGKFLDNKWLGTRGIYNFLFNDGRRFNLHYTAVKRNEWPKDPDKYFKIIASKSRTYEDRLKEIKSIADLHGGKILEPKFLGTEIKHKCQLKDGTVFQTTPYLLTTHGWPKNPRHILTSI